MIKLPQAAYTLYFSILISFVFPSTVWCQDDLKTMKSLSMEELLNLEVTSVSRRAEKLAETPSAVQVVTGEDVSKFGASNIPEALYLAGNLQVVQKGSHAFGASARGFNTDLANKLLVMIDGRSVYTPLYSGVFWERQDYVLNDINRVEVISGPGGTLWGANAVNGVINITTKSAKETQGLFVEAGAGNELRALSSIRYGGKLAPNVYYRVYGKYGKRDAFIFKDSIDAHDGWAVGQGGFRIDADPTSHSKFTLQGDLYNNKGDLATGRTSEVNGQNILGRWSHAFSERSDMRLQAYYDHTNLYDPTPALVVNGTILAPEGVFKDDLSTYDVDFQHQFKVGGYNHLVWGAGYRFTHDVVTNSPALGFLPTTLDQNLVTCFIQDEIQILKSLHLTLGSKVEHNAYVGYFAEPNGRLRWKVNEKQILWGAVSRAVRTPSRIDRNLTEGTPPNFVLLTGGNDFTSETLIAYEVGHRSQLSKKATTSLSLYYNQYDYIRSTVLNPTTVFPLYFKNGLQGNTHGFEANITYQVTAWWRLFSSYNRIWEDIKVKNGETDFNNAHNETADPAWQYTFRSSFELPFHLSFNGAFRWIDALPINSSGVLKSVPAYAELDGQISWHAANHIDVIIAGRNLLHQSHVEYGAPSPTLEAIQRSVYGKLVAKF